MTLRPQPTAAPKAKPSKPRDKNDRDPRSPSRIWLTRKRSSDVASAPRTPTAVRRADAVRDAHALDAICAARPLRAPALPRDNDTRTAGALALAKEIRRGKYEP